MVLTSIMIERRNTEVVEKVYYRRKPINLKKPKEGL